MAENDKYGDGWNLNRSSRKTNTVFNKERIEVKEKVEC
jgi:hypothetical protein